MALAETNATARCGSPVAPTARVEVSDFGPIASASVDLRPLTVFVGPSNSGKTYLATVLYALSRSFGGFPRYPGPSSVPLRSSLISETDSPSEEEWVSLAKSLATRGRAIRLNDFPGVFRTRTRSQLERVVTSEEGLRLEIKRCFDIDSLSDLVRWTAAESDARISASITDANRELWSFTMNIGNKGKLVSESYMPGEVMHQAPQFVSPVSAQYQLGNPDLMLPRDDDYYSHLFVNLLNTAPSSKNRKIAKEIFSRASDILRFNGIQGRTYYLPAARSGIMQSHRVIASSLVARATRGGLEHFPALPTLSGMIADFMEHLILYDNPREYYMSLRPLDRYAQAWNRQSTSQENNPVKEMANELERKLLGGTIKNLGESKSQYPDFVYVPDKSDKQLRMSRSSSMVSELAPLILFLRQSVFPQDMLIIEEPEAHLHPAAQTQMAIVLAKLARAGVRVIVTTHSDWLLKQIGNLIRQGELESGSTRGTDPSLVRGSLQTEHVGVWLFQTNDRSQGSIVKEIPYDRIDGIEPTEYADVDEELYNQSADLQNLLDDRENGGDF